MKNKILLIVVLILAVIYSLIRSFKKEASFFSSENKVIIKNTTTNEIKTFDMEDYLIGVVAGEMPASFEEEALKAQVIASRTYAYYKIGISKDNYDLTTDKSTQVYLDDMQMRDKWQDDYDYYLNKIKTVVKETENLVLTYNNQVIPAYYFAMSNGYTENGQAVFGENKEYLASVKSEEDVNHRNYKVTKTMAKNEVCDLLSTSCDNLVISNIVRNDTNRVDSLIINGESYSGIQLRKLLDLRSTDFSFEINDENVIFTTIGYGHGVGMSQYGANTMAQQGYKYEEILNHYYLNTQIKNIKSIK